MCYDWIDCAKCERRVFCTIQCPHSDTDIDNGVCECRDCKDCESCLECGADICENCDDPCVRCNQIHCNNHCKHLDE